MRLKSIHIDEYKNLKDFNLDFNTACFIDLFVGKNGSGKSNLFEAIILIFKHLFEFGKDGTTEVGDYEICYDLEGKEHNYKWDGNALVYNGSARKSVSESSLPDNILVYYSGHNDTIPAIIKKYQDNFSKRIKNADTDESRRFLGIGSDYKSILLGVLLLQPESSKAKNYVCDKLGIPQQEININLSLKRPIFAKKDFKVDRFDEETFYWGTKGVTLAFLKKIESSIKDSLIHADLYNMSKDIYQVKIDGNLYRSAFKDTTVTEQFRLFDNLNTLGMLEEMSAEFVLQDGTKATINQFSDGQFQSVYIYSILEFFKDRKCLLLLDEPDAFLHPEWQHGFLQQILDIAEERSHTNHILLSSHSASTIAPLDTSLLSLIVIENSKVKEGIVSKAEVIKSLSGNLIVYSEEEARLTITQMIDNTDEPILFVEGPSDVNILNVAFDKLFPGERRPFLIHDAFDRGFLRTLFARPEIFRTYPDKQFYALFDFDDAYDDWRQLGSDFVVCDVSKGLCTKMREKNAHCFLLPVQDNELKAQIWDETNPVEKVKPKPVFCIEHIFWPYVDQALWYRKDNIGNWIFKSDKQKIRFSEEVIPRLESSCFESLRPIFEFIKSRVSERST